MISENVYNHVGRDRGCAGLHMLVHELIDAAQHLHEPCCGKCLQKCK